LDDPLGGVIFSRYFFFFLMRVKPIQFQCDEDLEALSRKSRIHGLGKGSGPMLGNRSVAGTHSHVTDLAFVEIFKGTVGPVTVRVSVLKSRFARDDDQKRVPHRRYDSAPPLATKHMDVAPPIVDPANLKAPTHVPPHGAIIRTFLASGIGPFDPVRLPVQSRLRTLGVELSSICC
jgi:hypothetical protein